MASSVTAQTASLQILVDSTQTGPSADKLDDLVDAAERADTAVDQLARTSKAAADAGH